MSNFKRLPIMYLSVEHILSLYKNGKKIDYSNIGIAIDDEKIKVCRLMYTESYIKKESKQELYVAKKGYATKREGVFDWFIETIVYDYKVTGKKASYLKIHLSETLAFLKWLYENNTDIPEEIEDARRCFEKYTLFLKSCVRSGKFKTNRAQVIQSIALKLLKSITDDQAQYISLNIPLFTAKFDETGTIASSSENKKQSFRFYATLFRDIANFLLEEREFPLQTTLLNKRYYVIPFRRLRWLEIKKQTSDDAWETIKDNNEGKLENIKEALFSPKPEHEKEARLRLASVGLRAYYMYFLSISGMNAAVSGGLKWEKKYSNISDTYTFRGVKHRAKSKIVEFNIEKKFSKDFKLFVKLREFALDGETSEYLFFDGFGREIKKQTAYLGGSKPQEINKFMKNKIDKKLPIVSARQMRVNKTKQLLKTKDIKTVSVMAQSFIQTIAKHYTGESSDTSATQLTNYFDSLNRNLLNGNQNTQEISLGRCRNEFKPSSQVKLKGIKIDCSQPEGCLFCEHYCFVLDETDIRKLNSALFVINESKLVAKNEDHFKSVFKPVVERIDEILKLSSSSTPEASDLTKAVKADVFENENLHPYWENKLNMLIHLGVIK